MKKIVCIMMSIILLIGIMPQITIAGGNGRIVKNDSMEKYETGEELTVNTHPSFCAFGSGVSSKTTVITDTFARSGNKSIKQSGRRNTDGGLKIHNLYGKKLTSNDVGKTYELSFYVYADKESGVYKKNATNAEASELDSYRYTDEELKESTECLFYVYLAGPDAKSYKYRTGSVNRKNFYC